MAEDRPDGTPKPQKSRWIWILGISLIFLIVLLLVAPLIVANTGLRDAVINSILASPSVRASSESASFGWFSPLSIHRLQLTSANQHFDVRAEDIVAERTPWQLLSSSPDLGIIRVDKPHVQLELPLDLHIEGHNRLEPTFAAIVTDAALTVRVPALSEPAIDVDGINMTFRVEPTDNGRMLTLDPLVIFNRRELSPQLAKSLLHLIDPTLGDAPQVAGKVSLSLEKLRIPIGIPREQLVQRVEVEGKLGLHQVSTDVNNPIRQALIKMLADLNGKQVSDAVRLVDEAEIRFQVRDGRLHHEGLRIGFPEIDPDLVISSEGSIGLDETLDLNVELPRLDMTLRKEKGPAKCRITGTVRNPKISIQDGSLVLRQHDRKDPLLAVDGINLNMQVQNSTAGRVLAVEPVEVFKKQTLSLGLAGGLVHLIDPDLQDADQEITGEMSLSFSTLHIPLGGATDQLTRHVQAEGTLTLHQVSSQARNRSPMRQALIKMLADLHGKQASAVVRLVQDAEIRFQLRDGRLHHEGLRIGFPDIDPDLVVSSRGSIGLDQSLDLRLELPRLRKDKQEVAGPIQCHITGTLSDPRIAVHGTSLVVNLAGGDKPTLTVGNVNLTFSVENTEEGRMLALAPIVLFERQKLTPEMGDELLHLVAPTLGELQGVSGEISLSLDRFRVPLGVAEDEFAKRVDLAGKLQLHQISASVKTPILETMVKVLADMHGKKPSEVVRIVEEAEVRFHVHEGRMHHEGLRIGFPDIAPNLLVSSRGSVGFDRSLDLVLDVPRTQVPRKNDPVDPKSTAPVRLRVSGTIENPVVTEIEGEKDE